MTIAHVDSRNIAECPIDVRFTPKSRHWLNAEGCPLCAKSGREQVQQSNPLFDHLVGAVEQGRRHREAEHLGGFEIDHTFNFGGKLDRQIAGRGAFG